MHNPEGKLEESLGSCTEVAALQAKAKMTNDPRLTITTIVHSYPKSKGIQLSGSLLDTFFYIFAIIKPNEDEK